MQITITERVEKTINAKYIKITVPISEADEEEYNLSNLHGRDGATWQVKVDVDTGKICGWPGVVEYVHLKVRDEGVYRLLDDAGNEIARVEDTYVPLCIPNKNTDYLMFDIDKDGFVDGWFSFCSNGGDIAESFFTYED